jgi:(1->4)-alpha-D-glucan 1-alpha-D-glucosylmutase
MNTFATTISPDSFLNIGSVSPVYFPASTYRVQLNHTFTFKDLQAQIPYLSQLGISTIYAAPITTSSKDSAHGYDVTDFTAINPQIGTLEQLKELSAVLKQHNMSWVQDIVPNHMCFSTENIRLMDVLERGNHSSYYRFFDINWEHPDSLGKLIIPTLGTDIDAAIESGDIHVAFTDTGFSLMYFETAYPISITAYPVLISLLENKHIHEDFVREIKTYLDQAATASFEAFKKFKTEFSEKIKNDDNYSLEAEWLTKKCNKDKHILKALVLQQYYSLVHWKTSDSKMNYRRFFTINNLICLRMEEESVFNEYHSLTAYLYKENIIKGVRVDHIDGLYDPKQYLQRLRNLLGEHCYIIAEKILEYNEDFAKDWNIEGTSGYEFLSFTNRVLTDQQGAEEIRSEYFDFIQRHEHYDDMVYEKKHTFLYDHMQGELDNLMTLINQLHVLPAGTDQKVFRKSLAVFMAAFPIYRIYPDRLPLIPEAFKIVEKAYNIAIQHEPDLKATLHIIKNLFEYDEEQCDQKLTFIRKLMQFTGPLAAKGVEDTTFYIYNPLISHNEVGDAPCELGISIDSFHDKMLSRLANNPYSLNATSTHDTKRGEDARMRINVLSHLQTEWKVLLHQWHQENNGFIQHINDQPAPSLNDEYFIYQSLIGAFPENMLVTDEFITRTKNFVVKALKEAKVHTNYTQANDTYEHACTEFISSVLDSGHTFLKTFVPFVEKAIKYGAAYSLAQTIIKITAPGIPDIYQGSELWDISYVDPDNRRPVDYSFRKDLLAKIQSMENDRTKLLNFISLNRFIGAEKLFATWQLLELRNDLQDVFLFGTYTPVSVPSETGKKVIAYVRSYQNKHVLVIIPVGFEVAGETYSQRSWKDMIAQLPDGLPDKWMNVFTAETYPILKSITVAAACKAFPVAVFKSVQ